MLLLRTLRINWEDSTLWKVAPLQYHRGSDHYEVAAHPARKDASAAMRPMKLTHV
jgi:hypothetical protein